MTERFRWLSTLLRESVDARDFEAATATATYDDIWVESFDVTIVCPDDYDPTSNLEMELDTSIWRWTFLPIGVSYDCRHGLSTYCFRLEVLQ